MVVIASNSHAQKGEKVWGGVGGVWRNLREKEGNADYEGMVQPSQHVAPCVDSLNGDWAREI